MSFDGPTDEAALVGHLDHFIDKDWAMTPEDAVGVRSSEFTAISSKNPDFGYTKSRIWLRARLQNDSADQSDWVLYFPENFKQKFNVDLVRANGTIDSLARLNERSPFSDRPIADPQLAAPMTLAPGESATLLISLWSEGSSYITFSIETPQSYADIVAGKTAKNFVFYGMMILLIGASLVALVLLHNPIFLAYACYAGFALLYIMHADGVTFQYLWPNWPAFNSKASIVIGTGIIVCGSLYARSFLKTSQLHPRLDVLLVSLIALTLAINAGLYFTNPQLLKKVLVFLSLVAVISFALSGVIAAFTRYREVRFYLLAWVGAVISAVLLNLNHLLGVELDQNFIYDSIRAVLVFDAAMMGLAIADGYNQMRVSQRDALEDRLTVTRRNLELSERLTNLTNNYDAMISHARTRDEQIQNTVHDLRQPLHALRMNVGNMIRDDGAGQKDSTQIEATFSYLENLIDDYFIRDQNTHHSHPTGPSNDTDMSLNDVLSSIHGMFVGDAHEKNLQLSLSDVPEARSFDAFAVMRIVTNLVSNAIKYTGEGRVDIDARRDGRDIEISVTDTGPGLSEAEFDHALARDIRLAGTSSHVEGSGLGLSIANDLAQKNGLRLELGQSAERGTRITLTLPEAA